VGGNNEKAKLMQHFCPSTLKKSARYRYRLPQWEKAKWSRISNTHDPEAFAPE